MDRKPGDFVDETVLDTPKPTATSTDKRTSYRKPLSAEHISNASLDSSLGLLPLNVSNIAEQDLSLANVSYQLQQQRLLANNSLQRANKVSGIPSKYLQPNANLSSFSNFNMSNGSTISESDLLISPRKNTSTPRSSVAASSFNPNNSLRLSQSMARLSYQIGNNDVSIDNIVKEFRKVIDSNVFSPAEEAGSMLLADEQSWRRHHGMPVASEISHDAAENDFDSKVSVGTFFRQRSDTLADFQAALSPVKPKKPIALIDSSVSFADEQDKSIAPKRRKSLSISAIQKFLAETEDTPRKVTSYLLSQGKNVCEQSLPVSKNSSYTSNYSDNDVMRRIVSDKENTDTNNVPGKEQSVKLSNSSPEASTRTSTSSSSRTSSALTSLPNGKLPIESTRVELIWGCVKVDKCVSQDFLIRNKSPKRLCLQLSVSGHEFKIRKDNRPDSDPLSAAKIMLHPNESKLIIVSFIPTKIGAAFDELAFTSLDPNLQPTRKQSVKLFGYGGYGKMELHNLTKDTTGKFWLSLGCVENHNGVTQSFLVKNTGTLPSFAYISFSAKGVFAFANVSVEPSFFVLLPSEQREVVVSYVPTLEDHKVLQRMSTSSATVADIGSLLVIFGAEANRGRLRRLCRKCTEKGLEVDSISNILKDKIHGEVMPSDIVLLKETPGNLKAILKLFTYNEVVVTLEQDPEKTLMPQYPDESGMFQSLCQDNTGLCMDNTTIHASCKLEPSVIILTPPTKVRDSLILTSECTRIMHFETMSNPEGLEIHPKDGVIPPGRETVLNITFRNPTSENRLFKVLVYVENEVLEATVKIIYIHTQTKFDIE